MGLTGFGWEELNTPLDSGVWQWTEPSVFMAITRFLQQERATLTPLAPLTPGNLVDQWLSGSIDQWIDGSIFTRPGLIVTSVDCV